MFSGEAGCCSYSTGVRLTFLLAFKLYASSFLVLSRAQASPPPVPQRVSLILQDLDFSRVLPLWVGIGWSAHFSFSLHKGHCVTVNLLSGGRLSGISHARRVESFVLSLNKRREEKQPKDPHLLGGYRAGTPALDGSNVFPFGALPQPSWDWELHPWECWCL